MYIRNVLLTSILFSLGLTASAQSSSKVSFGLRGGFDYQTFNGENKLGDKLELSLVPRYNVGLVVDIPLADEFYIQPSLLYTTKGAKAKDDFGNVNFSSEVNLGYLELPVNFVYKPVLGNGNLMLGVGPYMAYGLGGKVEYAVDGNSTKDDIIFTDEYTSNNPLDQRHYKPFDFGGNILFGYQFAGGFSAQLNAQLGMVNIKSNNTEEPNSPENFKNTGFGISLGYMFNK